MADGVSASRNLRHQYGGWRIDGENVSAARALELAEAFKDDAFIQAVKEQIRADADEAERKLEERKERAAREAAHSVDEIARLAVKARVARDEATALAPVAETPF